MVCSYRGAVPGTMTRLTVGHCLLQADYLSIRTHTCSHGVRGRGSSVWPEGFVTCPEQTRVQIAVNGGA
jgi:hypothetical protein